MTPAQLLTLKNDIAADSTMSAQPNNSDGAIEISRLYNLNASPNFTVWKTNVPLNEVGKKFNGTELAGLSTANNTRLQTIALFLVGGVNPSLADNRQFFDDVFSGAGGTNTRANLLALWKRLATRGEKLFATGTGSDPAPGTLVVEGDITAADVTAARNS